MSHDDEARYGRACLLVLNVCPFTLRQVIDDYSLRHARSLSLCDFLEKNKDRLFHLYKRECCCGHKSNKTPMYQSQWDSLFNRNTLSCLNGKQVDCPCKNYGKAGATTNVMDVTLCCLIINNICPGVDVNHIKTIREIRNKLIHAESARLDLLTFNGYMNRVKTAICELAKNVSTTLHTGTLKMIVELENRVMNPVELRDLRNLIIDEKRFTDLETDVLTIADDLNQTRQEVAHISTTVNETTEKITWIEDETRRERSQIMGIIARQGQGTKGELQEQLKSIQQDSNEHRRQIDDHGRQIDGYGRQIEDHGRQIDDHSSQITYIKQRIPYDKVPSRQGVRKMMEKLMEINDEITQVIQLSPLQQTEKELPIELLYASVVICEDQKYVTMGIDSRDMEEITRYENSPKKKGLLKRNWERIINSRFFSSKLDTEPTTDFDRGSYKYNRSPRREVTNPDDIFKKDGKYVRRIYMLGDAAHGKTTYCVWLLRKWLNAKRKQRKIHQKFDKWEHELKKFDFVFLIKFRNVNDPDLVSVVDMICQDAFESNRGYHDAIRYVLSSDEYKSLIILDGLDEWNSNSTNRMPEIDVSGSVTCFISMRPWVLSLLPKKPQRSDRVLEILGFSETGMENIIKNVLVNHYKLKEKTQNYTEAKDRILKSLKNKSLNSFMQIPLLAVVYVQIWYDGKQVGDSLTSFYAEMLNMLLERANQKHDIKEELDKTEKVDLPNILSVYDNVENCSPVLLKLGKVAYEGLISNKTKLVFQRSKLEKEIGVRELQFALDVGLISQKEARSLTTKNVSVHFFHKSIQEFLAVIYIGTNKEVGDSFCKHLSNVKVVMKLSNVIMFICGMYPSLGSVISQRVVSVTNSDTEICKYRESPSQSNSTVIELYKLQISWYREFKERQTDSPVTFHVSDVYLFNSDIETVRVTRELLFDHHVVDVRSLFLLWVPTDGERGITNTELHNFLCNKHQTLDMVFINGYDTDRSVTPICIPSLKTLYLLNVKIFTNLDDDVCPPLLTDMTSLRVLRLWNMTLGYRGLGLSADMVHIEEVRLFSVNMSSTRWQQLIQSVLNIKHKFNVELRDRNIDDESMTKIRSSPEFNVTQDGGYQFYFTREWPPQGTQYDQKEILYTRL